MREQVMKPVKATFEGPQGGGKSTWMRRIQTYLEHNFICDVVIEEDKHVMTIYPGAEND